MSAAHPAGARWRRWLLPWGLALAALLNLAYPTYRHYDFSHSLDTRSYLRLAAGRFDSVSVTRRYRLLVPLAAGALARPLAALGSLGPPGAPTGEGPRRLAFHLINCALLAAAGATWYRAARLTGADAGWAAAAMLAVLSSRWASYAAGLPLTDSLYWLVLGLAYYAGRRGPRAGWAVGAALLLGPLAKESFVFVLPWLAWYGRPALPWRGQALALAGGLGALLLAHRWVDGAVGAAPTAAVGNALAHVENIGYSLGKLATLKGLADAASSFGLLWGLVLAALAWPAGRRALAPVLGSAEAWWLLIVLVHLLLSGDLGRMGYLAAPVATGALALALAWLRTYGTLGGSTWER